MREKGRKIDKERERFNMGRSILNLLLSKKIDS